MFAEANTSGLTPCSICAASMSDPANEYRTLACENCCPYAVKAAFNDAAAETVRLGLLELEPPDPDALVLLLLLPPRARAPPRATSR